ncbi:MAG: T9SS type A sorting domain-containing protein [Balneola sp.]
MNKLLIINIIIAIPLITSLEVSSQTAVSLNGPIESDIRDIVMVSDSIFVVGYENGIFKRSITDTLWNYVETEFFTNLSFIKSDEYYLVGTGGGFIVPEGLAFNQLFRSFDSGKTWEEFNDGLQYCHTVTELLETSLHDLLVGCNSLYELDKASSSFSDLLPGIGARVQFIKEVDNHIFAGTSSGVFISDSQALSFEPFGLDTLRTNNMLTRNDTLFFATNTGIISYYNDNWTFYDNPNELEFHFLQAISNKLIAGTEEELYYFSVAENELSPVFQDQFSGNLNRLETHEGALLVGTTKGLYSCSPSADTCTNLSIPNSFVQSIALNSSNSALFSSTFNGIYKYDLESKTWDSTNIILDDPEKVLVISEDSLISYDSPFVYTCTYSSSSCNSVTIDPGFPLFDITKDDNGILYVASNRKVFKSEDAKVFEEIEFNENRTNRSLFTIGDSLLFIGTNEALIRKALITGDTTQIKFNGFGAGNFASANDGTIIAYAFGGLYRSDDFGVTWNNIFSDSNILDDEFISNTAITDDGVSIFLFTTFNRIFVTNDGGMNWGVLDRTFNARVYTSIIKNNKTLFVGTWGGGVFELALPLNPPITISNENKAISGPKSFILYQNYPNPFNPSSTFSFELNEPNIAQVSVYNVFGQLVYSKNLGKLNSGVHTETINLSNYSSGMYLLKVSAGNQSQTIKMTLIK